MDEEIAEWARNQAVEQGYAPISDDSWREAVYGRRDDLEAA